MDHDEKTTKLLESVRLELEKLLEKDGKINNLARKSLKAKSVENRSSRAQPLLQQLKLTQTQPKVKNPTVPEMQTELPISDTKSKPLTLPPTLSKPESKVKLELDTTKQQLKSDTKTYTKPKSDRITSGAASIARTPLTKIAQGKVQIQPREIPKNHKDNILIRLSNNKNARPYKKRQTLLDASDQDTSILRQHLDNNYNDIQSVGSKLEAINFNVLRNRAKDLHLSSRMIELDKPRRRTNVTPRPGITLDQVPELNNFYDICDQLNNLKGRKRN